MLVGILMVFPAMAAMPFPSKDDPTPVIAVPVQSATAVPAQATAQPPAAVDPARIATAPDPAGLILPAVTVTAAQGVSAPAAALPVPMTAASKAPYNIQFDTTGTTKIKITWSAADGEPWVFNIFRKISAEKEFIPVNTEPLKVTVYVDAAIKTATAYDYKIEATDNSGNAYMSDVKQVNSAGLGLPQKPFTFKTFQNIEKVTIKWSAGSRGSFDISGYNLYRGKTADKMEFFKFLKPSATLYDDEKVEPAIKYFYRMTAVDVAGYESDPTDTEAVIPFPRPRTGLVLMGTGFRNNITDNFGINADFLFTYYIGSIFSDFLGKGDSLGPLSIVLFTGDIKGTIFNEFEQWPSLALGFTYTVLLQINLSGSDTTSASATFNSKTPINQMYGLYLAASKKVIWDNTLHIGGMTGFGKNGQTDFMSYLSGYINTDPLTGNVKLSNYAYYLGFSRPIFGKSDIKVEVIVPVESNKNPFFPNYYLINTRVANLTSFDLSYFHFPGGSAILGFINFRFSVYPNPYK